MPRRRSKSRRKSRPKKASNRRKIRRKSKKKSRRKLKGGVTWGWFSGYRAEDSPKPKRGYRFDEKQLRDIEEERREEIYWQHHEKLQELYQKIMELQKLKKDKSKEFDKLVEDFDDLTNLPIDWLEKRSWLAYHYGL